jgi:hypothetical protein
MTATFFKVLSWYSPGHKDESTENLNQDSYQPGFDMNEVCPSTSLESYH